MEIKISDKLLQGILYSALECSSLYELDCEFRQNAEAEKVGIKKLLLSFLKEEYVVLFERSSEKGNPTWRSVPLDASEAVVMRECSWAAADGNVSFELGISEKGRLLLRRLINRL
jgi:hypothetical protein